MVYQTRAAHSSAKFWKKRHFKEKRPQKHYKPPSVTESCDSGVRSQASEISIKICNDDDDNVVIQLFRNDTKDQKKNKKKKKASLPVMRQSAGGGYQQKYHSTKANHSEKHQSHKNKCKCYNIEKSGLLSNLYRRTFGPTIDETLLAGMEALYNTCTPDSDHEISRKQQNHYIKSEAFDESRSEVSDYRGGRYQSDSIRATSQGRRPTEESSSYQTLNDPSTITVSTQDKSKHRSGVRYSLHSTRKHLKLAKRHYTQTYSIKHDNTYKKSRSYAKGDNFGEFSDPSAILSDIVEETKDSGKSEKKCWKSSSDSNILYSYSRKTVPLTKFTVNKRFLNYALHKPENARDTKSADEFCLDNKSTECQESTIVLSDTSKTTSNLPKRGFSKFSSKHLNVDYGNIKMKNKKTAASDADLPTIVSVNRYGIVKTQFTRSNGTSLGFCSEPTAVFQCSVGYTTHGSGGDEQLQSDTKSKISRIISISSSSTQTPKQIISSKKVTKALSKIREIPDLKVSDKGFVYIPYWERKKTFPTAYFKQIESHQIMPQREKAGGSRERTCETNCEEDNDKPDRNYISSIIECLRDIDAKRQVKLSSFLEDENNSRGPARKKNSRGRCVSFSSIESSSFSSTRSSFRSDCTECVNNLVQNSGQPVKKTPGVVIFPTGQTFMPTLNDVKLLKQSVDFFPGPVQNDVNVYCCKKQQSAESPYMPSQVVETEKEESKIANYDPKTESCSCDELNPVVNQESQTMAPSFTDIRSKISPQQSRQIEDPDYYNSSENRGSKSIRLKNQLPLTDDSEFIQLTSKKDNLNRFKDEECQDNVCEGIKRQALRKNKHIISSTSEPDLYSTASESTGRFEAANRVHRNTQTLDSANSEPSIAGQRQTPLEEDSEPSNLGPSQDVSVTQEPSRSDRPLTNHQSSGRSYKSYASTEIFDMDGIRWRSVPTETSDEKIYPPDLNADAVTSYSLGPNAAYKKCLCKKKELGIQVQPADPEFIKPDISEPTKMISYPLSNNTEVQTDPVPLCCLSRNIPEKAGIDTGAFEIIPEKSYVNPGASEIIQEKSYTSKVQSSKKDPGQMTEPTNSLQANTGNSRTNTITTAPTQPTVISKFANTGNTVYSVYSANVKPGSSIKKSESLSVDAYKKIMNSPESFVTNSVSLQEIIEKNTIAKETRFAITRVTKYADFTTYEVLKSTKARPKVIPCVTENVFIVKKKNEQDECVPVHQL